ncbi:MAG: LPS export ABC transporter periplasmic protein LptC [Eudoraea sp.]|nr:LPS export ABC transporter periplasmic protein LptC [Eudoraea sp.]
MIQFIGNKNKSIAAVFSVALFFFNCTDTYKRVGEEAGEPIFPQGVAQNFVLTYTETANELKSEGEEPSKVIAVLSSPISEDFDNLRFPHKTFPEGLQVEYYDKENNKSTITADYGILYSSTNLIDLQGNVILETHDGKRLETSQLYYDKSNEWIFTEAVFQYTNPEDGTIMEGQGMDFNKEFSVLEAHKTTGLMLIKEEDK